MTKNKEPKLPETDYKFDAKLYRERRDRGLRGQVTAPTVHQTVTNEKNEVVGRVPLGVSIGQQARYGKRASDRRLQYSEGHQASHKGFKGHKVKTPQLLPKPWGNMTNHDRMRAKLAARVAQSQTKTAEQANG